MLVSLTAITMGALAPGSECLRALVIIFHRETDEGQGYTHEAGRHGLGFSRPVFLSCLWFTNSSLSTPNIQFTLLFFFFFLFLTQGFTKLPRL